MKVDYKRLFLIGLGFLVINTFWSVYNSYVPIFLRDIFKEHRYPGLIVGALLTLDNIAAITLQPFFGALSDNTWNRFGRRMPYIIFGLPVAAFAFILIPLARTVLPLMLIAITVGNIAMAVLRAPTVALMPDITPSPLRSKANGVINLMGGLGALIAYFVLSALYKQSPVYPFLVTSLLMVVVAFALYYWVREEKTIEHEIVVKKGPGIIKSLVSVFKDSNSSVRNILLAIFFWFAGWSAVEAFFTTYGVEQWNLDPGTASFYLGFFSLSFLICAIPSGFIASKFGRRKTIQVGVAGLGLILASFTFIEPLILVAGLLIVGGAFWALVNINSYPMVVDMAKSGQIGTYTGLYYFFASLAAISAPPLVGWLMDLLGIRTLFAFAFIAFFVAYGLISNVNRGEVVVPTTDITVTS